MKYLMVVHTRVNESWNDRRLISLSPSLEYNPRIKKTGESYKTYGIRMRFKDWKLNYWNIKIRNKKKTGIIIFKNLNINDT